METSRKLYSQIACEAGVDPGVAQAAAYLLDLSRAGRTLDQAAALMRQDRATVRDIARDWGIPFPDYDTGNPVVLIWVKFARGEWTLEHDGRVVARVLSVGDHTYRAQWEDADGSFVHRGSNAEIAARRLSQEVERQSVALFGVDDVEIRFPATGGISTLAPIYADNIPRLRAAIAA